ncbi:hypothetical protein NPIL_421531 [Nephila pilipes]|uniref:Uncharacterized protein n=1 Tax=Nephila pilipes TaxID=299642 RepID=A0A8X6Q481_NEPPI|nr:hypothetical protein NPIL_421531 [Nephila pilipes]
MRHAQLFPFLYGAQDMEKLQLELQRWKNEKENIEGKLSLLYPCPNPGCLHNQQLNIIMSNINSKTNNLPTTNKKRQHENTADGFIIPTKTAKQPKILQNKSITETLSKFNTLRINNIVDVAEALPPPSIKIPPVMMKLNSNYDLLLQEIHHIAPAAGKATTKSNNRNKTFTSTETRPNISYAQALSNNSNQQRALLDRVRAEASSEPRGENNPNSQNKIHNNNQQNDSDNGFTMSDTIKKLKSLFLSFPNLKESLPKNEQSS